MLVKKLKQLISKWSKTKRNTIWTDKLLSLFLTGEGLLTETELLEKAATVKRFEYSPLDSELKKQTEIAKKECPVLDKVYEFCKKDDEIIITKI